MVLAAALKGLLLVDKKRKLMWLRDLEETSDESSSSDDVKVVLQYMDYTDENKMEAFPPRILRSWGNPPGGRRLAGGRRFWETYKLFVLIFVKDVYVFFNGKTHLRQRGGTITTNRNNQLP